MRKLTLSGKIREVQFVEGDENFGKRCTFLLDEQVYSDGVRTTETHGCVKWGNQSNWLKKLEENKLTVIVEALQFHAADAFNDREVGLTFILQADIVVVA